LEIYRVLRTSIGFCKPFIAPLSGKLILISQAQDPDDSSTTSFQLTLVNPTNLKPTLAKGKTNSGLNDLHMSAAMDSSDNIFLIT